MLQKAQRDRIGRQALKIGARKLEDLGRLLAGDQATRNLRRGRRGEHRLGALADKAAPDAVAIKRRARPLALKGGIAGFATKTRRAGLLAELLIVEGKLGKLLALLDRQRDHVVIKARDRHTPVVVVQLGD